MVCKSRAKTEGSVSYAEVILFLSQTKIKFNILAENKHLHWKMANLCPIALLLQA